jgi:hypothetical protein
MFPVPCPALYDVKAGCYPAKTDCSTVRHCFGEDTVSSCKVGFANDCWYRNCIPTGPCPTGSQLCPADDAIDLGPICVPMTVDCKTLTYCMGDDNLHYCDTGKAYSCQAKACVALTADCPKAEYPQLCPARGTAPAVCAAPYHDCATAMKCGDDVVVAPVDETISCQYPNYTSPVGNKCPTFRHPTEPKFCPAGGGLGPDCYHANIDCATATTCPGKQPVICSIGTKVDCNYPNSCVVPDGKCPTFGFPAFTKFCPALGGVGPDCYSADTDCSTVVYCKTEDTIGYCPTGKKWDCPTSTCK